MNLSEFEPVFGSADAVRFCYLRVPTLRKALEDNGVLDALLDRLEVPAGNNKMRQALTPGDKVKLIGQQIDHFRSVKTSQWYQVAAPEVLAAALFESDLPIRDLSRLFCKVSKEADLLEPVIQWLQGKGLDTFAEVPMGTKRVDVLGFKKGGFLSFITSKEAVAVELKNDTNQLKRGLDQMTTFAEYADKVYLAVTPFMAAQNLSDHAAAPNVHHWDPGVLDRKLEAFGFGLLLVEGAQVYEYRPAKIRAPSDHKLKELETTLLDFEPVSRG